MVLVGRDRNRRVVTAANAAAQAMGVRPGLPATQAHALVPGLAVHDADPAGDAAGLDDLALWALRRYAPLVAADPPDGLVIDATGCAHLHGGEAAMLTDMIARLASAGIAARAAMAPTRGAAHALARFGAHGTIVHDENLPTALATLPVAALRLPADMVDALRRLGLDTIGDLAVRPRAPLVRRFGPVLARRLDQAFGREAEPMRPIAPPTLMRVERAFAEPIVTAEVLARWVEKLTEALCADLESRGLGARRLDLLFYRLDSRIEAVRIGTARPARAARRLARLLAEKLERVDPGPGIERMALSAPVVEPLNYRPAPTTLAEAPEPDLSGLIDTLTNRVGPLRLYRVAAVESDVPERSIRRIPPLAGPTALRWPPHWPRPTRLLRPPEPVETLALLPDHPPAQFTWRGVRRRVRCADGPERIHGEWIRREAETNALRDYFQVEDESGQRFWLFRAGDGENPETGSQRWFLHGLFG